MLGGGNTRYRSVSTATNPRTSPHPHPGIRYAKAEAGANQQQQQQPNDLMDLDMYFDKKSDWRDAASPKAAGSTNNKRAQPSSPVAGNRPVEGDGKRLLVWRGGGGGGVRVLWTGTREKGADGQRERKKGLKISEGKGERGGSGR